jgi:AcrR family transcriptional regulator
MSAPTSEDRPIVDAALALTAEKGWAAVTLWQVAVRSGLKLAQVTERCPSKYAILCRLVALVDRAVLDQVTSEAFADETPRARLLELLLLRLEAMGPYKAGLKALRQAALCDPGITVALGLTGQQSMTFMLEAAAIAPAPHKVLGLGALFARAVYLWIDDATPDLGPTTAALDSMLARAERFL